MHVFKLRLSAAALLIAAAMLPGVAAPAEKQLPPVPVTEHGATGDGFARADITDVDLESYGPTAGTGLLLCRSEVGRARVVTQNEPSRSRKTPGQARPAAGDYQLFAPTNLVAWCIVPFDAKKRGPEQRAEMLEQLGFKLFAYDYRAEHVPTFDAEMEALQRHHIRLLAWWFPGVLNDEARHILDVMNRHKVQNAQLWVTGGGEAAQSPEEQPARVAAEAERLTPIATEAARLGHRVALYNHGGWFGEPENQLQIIAAMSGRGVTNVGIVYNLHHGHEHLDRFPELLRKMKPHLLVLNLNGMVRDGEKTGKKILTIGQGDLDLKLLRIIRDSGWHGPLGILNHTDEDAETRLRQNLQGLERLVRELNTRVQ